LSFEIATFTQIRSHRAETNRYLLLNMGKIQSAWG